MYIQCEGIEGIEFMGRNSLGKILNNFEITCPAENNYMYIDYTNMPARDLYRDYEEIYLHNRTLIERALEALTIQRRNDSIHKLIKKLGDDKTTCPYKIFNEIEKLRNSLETVPSVPSNIQDMRAPEDMTNIDLHRYFGVEIFNDCIMWNVSPNWKGDCSSMEHRCRIEFLKLVIDKFFHDCNRFTKHKFVIECGKDGNHTHAHCVFELNPKMKKQNETWMKSNIGRDFRTIWKKINEGIEGGYEGMVDSCHALQKIILRKDYLRDDKLDYLIEENKPLSHQNANHEYYPVLGGNWD